MMCAELTLVNSEIIELDKLERVWTLWLAEMIVKDHKKVVAIQTPNKNGLI